MVTLPADEMDTEDVEPVDSSPWADSDRDYTYEEVNTSTGPLVSLHTFVEADSQVTILSTLVSSLAVR